MPHFKGRHDCFGPDEAGAGAANAYLRDERACDAHKKPGTFAGF